MNKRAVLIILVAGAIALALAPAAPAQETGPQVRIVNLDAYGSTSPSDAELADLATMDTTKDAKLFPPADDFVVSIEPCQPENPGVITGGFPVGPGVEAGGFLVTSDFVSIDAMTKEVLPYRFAAVGGDAQVGRYSVVVVRKDKSVVRFAAVPGASDSDTSLKTNACLIVGPNDKILTFVETSGSVVTPQDSTEGVDTK